jgi:hypothetical protein
LWPSWSFSWLCFVNDSLQQIPQQLHSGAFWTIRLVSSAQKLAQPLYVLQEKEKAPAKPKEEPKNENEPGFKAFGGKPNKLR